MSESSGPKPSDWCGTAHGLCPWTLSRESLTGVTLSGVVDICLQTLSSFEFLFLKSHSILPLLIRSAAQIHTGETTTRPGNPCPQRCPAHSHMLISRAWAALTGSEVWQGMKQLLPLLEKEIPPNSFLVSFPQGPCPSLLSQPGTLFSPGFALLLCDGSRYPWKVLSHQLSTSEHSLVLLPSPMDWEKPCGTLPLLICRS